MSISSEDRAIRRGKVPSGPSRRRMWGFRAALIFAALLPLLWGLGAMEGAIGGGPHLAHELIGGGVALAALWLAPLVVMWRPARLPVALLGLLAFTLAAVLAAVLSASYGVLAIILAVQAVLVVALHPYRAAAFRGPVAFSALLLPLALLAAAALARYAVTEAGLQATGDAHALEAHYFDQAWFALAVALYLVLAAVRDDARRFAGRAGGAGLLAFGAVGILLPSYVGSVGATWGAVAVAGGLVTIVLAEVEARRASVAEGVAISTG